MNELIELLDLQLETARDEEHFSIEETVRAVFGDSVEIVEFIPYGDN